MTQPLEFKDLWTAGGVLLGFEVAALSWRVTQESKRGAQNDITWLPPADFLNLLAMGSTAVGIFILPALDMLTVRAVRLVFGLSALLFVGHAFAIVGHYDMYNWRTPRSMNYFPCQEKVAVAATVLAVLGYMVLAFYR